MFHQHTRPFSGGVCTNVSHHLALLSSISQSLVFLTLLRICEAAGGFFCLSPLRAVQCRVLHALHVHLVFSLFRKPLVHIVHFPLHWFFMQTCIPCSTCVSMLLAAHAATHLVLVVESHPSLIKKHNQSFFVFDDDPLVSFHAWDNWIGR